MGKPKLFIGSALPNLKIVRDLELELHDDAEIHPWDDGFEPGQFTLEQLTSEAEKVDFAAFVLGREDVTQSKNVVEYSPRDNVVFEAGLFTAALGRLRTFFVVDSLGTKLPSDWKGLGHLVFDQTAERSRERVLTAADEIRRRIQSLGAVDRAGPGSAIAGHWWQYATSTEQGSVLSFLDIRAPLATGGAFELIGDAWSKDGEKIAHYGSRAAQFDVTSRTLWYYWDGAQPNDKAPTKGRPPTYFGVGQITFIPAGDVYQTASGFYSTSHDDDLSETQIKHTEYVRATPREVSILLGTRQDERAAVVQSRLHERSTPKT